ncbi:uncharacterized protein LOC144877764 [Branchiostoma floridae x Branchiostoma japonicum]
MAVACPYLPTPSQLVVSDHVCMTYGCTASFSCSTGYELTSNSPNQTVCQADGMWSGKEPACQAIACPTLPSPSQLVVSDHMCMTYGCTASFSCSTGFELTSGSPNQTVCQADGMWSGQEPACQAIHCPELQRPEFGNIIGNETTWGSVIQFECEYGFSQGSTPRTCQGAGTWSGNDVICKEPTTEQPTTTEPKTVPSTTEEVASHTSSEATSSVTVQTDPEMTNVATTAVTTYIVETTTTLMATVESTTDPEHPSPSVSTHETNDTPPTTLAAILVPVTDPTTEQPTTTELNPTLATTEETTSLPFTSSEATPSVTVQHDPETINPTTTAGMTYSVEPNTTLITTVEFTTGTDNPSQSASTQKSTDIPPTTLAAILVPFTESTTEQQSPAEQNSNHPMTSSVPYTSSEVTSTATAQNDPETINPTITASFNHNVEPSTTMTTTVETAVDTEHPTTSTSTEESTDTTLIAFADIAVPITDCRFDHYVPGGGMDVITSPNYPKLYPPNLDCWYVITTDPGHALQVTILNFDLPERSTNNDVTSSGCTDDYLELHAPLAEPPSRLISLDHMSRRTDWTALSTNPSQRYCGRALTPGATFSSGTTFVLHFVTDGVNTSGGFSILISSVSA